MADSAWARCSLCRLGLMKGLVATSIIALTFLLLGCSPSVNLSTQTTVYIASFSYNTNASANTVLPFGNFEGHETGVNLPQDLYVLVGYSGLCIQTSKQQTCYPDVDSIPHNHYNDPLDLITLAGQYQDRELDGFPLLVPMTVLFSTLVLLCSYSHKSNIIRPHPARRALILTFLFAACASTLVLHLYYLENQREGRFRHPSPDITVLTGGLSFNLWWLATLSQTLATVVFMSMVYSRRVAAQTDSFSFLDPSLRLVLQTGRVAQARRLKNRAVEVPWYSKGSTIFAFKPTWRTEPVEVGDFFRMAPRSRSVPGRFRERKPSGLSLLA